MIQKVILSREEKKLLFTNVIHFWDDKNLTMANFQKISETIKLPITLIETMILHYENMFSLGKFLEKLVFKGGTAVQHYLNPMLQRGSVDLDFNTEIGHPEVILKAVDAVNEHLAEQENIIDIYNVQFGKFHFEHEDPKSGTLTFSRVLPTKLNEFIKINQTSIQAKKTQIQINYRHSWLPAVQIRKQSLNLFPSEFLHSNHSVFTPIASPGDLISDKILTLTQVRDFGRERLKDVYDLMNLSKLNEPDKFSIANKKLETIARAEGIKKYELVSSALKHLDDMKSLSTQVIGFKSQVAIHGWAYIEGWENSIEDTIASLESELMN